MLKSGTFNRDPEVSLPNDLSDGDPDTWPSTSHQKADDKDFRADIFSAWKEKRRIVYHSYRRRFNQLPAGYCLFESPKSDGQRVGHIRLFGHPSRLFYDSSAAFFPHFEWLMNARPGKCPCKVCNKRTESLEMMARFPRRNFLDDQVYDSAPEFGTGRTRSKSREKVFTDEEGTPDPYHPLLRKLHQLNRVNYPIEEKESMDWRAERESLPKLLSRTSLQHQFLPRIGELVLWVAEMEGDLVMNPRNNQFQLYSFEKGEYLDPPRWMAGLVTQMPKGTVDFQDLTEDVDKNDGINDSGYRIETFPDPNDDINKSYTKRYKYVPLRQIRPLSYWHLYLRDMNENLHPSIKNALTIYSSVSLVEKFKFRGDWPEGEIFCKGMYLGPELLIVGDAVRLLPGGHIGRWCTEIMVITSIRLRLHGITSENAYMSQLLCKETSIKVYGHAYTTIPKRAYDDPNPKAVDDTELLTQSSVVDITSLGPWYRLNSPSTRYMVSFDRIIGRLHEPSATCIWLNSVIKATPKITITSHDIRAVRAGREYSTQVDARIPENRTWFWADTRAETLAVETINGWEVGRYDDSVRTDQALKAWRATLRVLDGTYTDKDIQDAAVRASLGKKRSKKPGAKIVNGKVVYLGTDGNKSQKPSKKRSSKMVESAFGDSPDEDPSDGKDEVIDNATLMQGLTIQQPEPAMRSRSRTMIEQAASSDDEPIVPPHVERGGTEETDGGDYIPG